MQEGSQPCGVVGWLRVPLPPTASCVWVLLGTCVAMDPAVPVDGQGRDRSVAEGAQFHSSPMRKFRCKGLVSLPSLRASTGQWPYPVLMGRRRLKSFEYWHGTGSVDACTVGPKKFRSNADLRLKRKSSASCALGRFVLLPAALSVGSAIGNAGVLAGWGSTETCPVFCAASMLVDRGPPGVRGARSGTYAVGPGSVYWGWGGRCGGGGRVGGGR